VDKRQVVLDTETTGLEVSQGHRIIEIGCVELVNRRVTGRHFHQYIHPEREIDEGAMEVHGITLEFLSGKPNFGQIAADFIEFVHGAELIIHNAAFDVGFLDAEFHSLEQEYKAIAQMCDVVDTLQMARHKHPGQRNNLDALCQRYEIDNSSRALHGALLDAEILAEVYLAMTGGQASLSLSSESGSEGASSSVGSPADIRRLPANRKTTPIIRADKDELERHEARLSELEKTSDNVLWRTAPCSASDSQINHDRG
jgi:DNA polymerase-3 subunit epsilon|tara:strand:+ start:2154 stop:2921 length:768 start_codon:yes stop_codon:yes gene_type:complete